MDKRLTPIMLYFCTVTILIGTVGNWYFILNPSGHKYTAGSSDPTEMIISLLLALGVMIGFLYLIKIADSKLAKLFWSLLILLHVFGIGGKQIRTNNPDEYLRLLSAITVSLEFLLFSTFLYIYKKKDINLFGKFDVIKKSST